MTTAIVSDLHLGANAGVDLARRPEPLERLVEAIGDADRVVFLGDLLELRERPSAAVLEDLAPVLRRIGEAVAGRQVTIVPGNHDHQLVGPAIERARLASGGPLPVAGSYPPAPGELASHVIDLLPRSDVEIAYPGVWLRDDVYATHGHYLDAHLTVPRVECLIAAAVERYATALGADGPTSPAGYEAILSPIYALAHAVAQSTRAHPLTNSSSLSRRVWSSAMGHGPGGRFAGTVVGRGGIPLAVAAINLAGLGPFKPDISGEELRRAGLAAIGEVVDRLGIDAGYVIFGHTHRAGPLDGDATSWKRPGGTELVNTGSWIYEDVFVDGTGPANPYWPGRVTMLGEQGPPEQRSLLDSLDLARLLG